MVWRPANEVSPFREQSVAQILCPKWSQTTEVQEGRAAQVELNLRDVAEHGNLQGAVV